MKVKKMALEVRIIALNGEDGEGVQTSKKNTSLHRAVLV